MMENLAKASGSVSPTQKAKAQDFVKRYTTGDPTEGYSDEEAEQMAKDVLPQLSPEQLQQALSASAQNINANAKQSDRTSLAEMMQQRKAGKGMVDITRAGENVEPGAASQSQTQAPGLDDVLGGLLGGMSSSGASPSSGGDLGDILGGLLGGDHSPTSSGGGFGDVLGSILGGAPDAAPAPQPKAQQSGDASSGGDMMDMLSDVMKSPMGKALIAGAAAFAMKSMLNND